MKSYYRDMANSPSENTVTVSFTMPRSLLAAIQEQARRDLSNQSEVMRRALMNSLTSSERAAVLREVGAQEKNRVREPVEFSYLKRPAKKVSSKPLSDAAILAKKLSEA
jgi:Arc/MetJ-type ribon-helix-helix transcriptional regulator